MRKRLAAVPVLVLVVGCGSSNLQNGESYDYYYNAGPVIAGRPIVAEFRESNPVGMPIVLSVDDSPVASCGCVTHNVIGKRVDSNGAIAVTLKVDTTSKRGKFDEVLSLDWRNDRRTFVTRFHVSGTVSPGLLLSQDSVEVPADRDTRVQLVPAVPVEWATFESTFSEPGLPVSLKKSIDASSNKLILSIALESGQLEESYFVERGWIDMRVRAQDGYWLNGKLRLHCINPRPFRILNRLALVRIDAPFYITVCASNRWKNAKPEDFSIVAKGFRVEVIDTVEISDRVFRFQPLGEAPFRLPHPPRSRKLQTATSPTASRQR